MYRTCLLSALLLLSGCEMFKGPRARRDEPPLDTRNLSIAEQQERGRDRLAYPDSDPAAGPKIDGLTMPGQQGR